MVLFAAVITNFISKQIMANRFKIFLLFFCLSTSVFSQDLNEKCDQILARCDEMAKNIIRVGPALDSPCLTDSITGEKYSWAVIYSKINDSTQIREQNYYSESNSFTRCWYIDAYQPIFCYEQGEYQESWYLYYFFFEGDTLIGALQDTIASRDFYRKKEIDIKNEFDLLNDNKW